MDMDNMAVGRSAGIMFLLQADIKQDPRQYIPTLSEAR